MSISRPACAVAGALLIAVGLTACGGSSNTTTNADAAAGATQPGSRPRGANGGAPGGQSGQPPSSQSGQPPSSQNGQPPTGQGRRNPRPDSPQFQKLRAALQKCGVTFPGRPPSGQPPQGQGTTSSSAS